MAIRKVSCVYRGNTFYCDYEAMGVGAEREIRVRYNGGELDARTNGRSDDIVAQGLLEELVMLESISITVVGGTADERRLVTRSGDAHDRRAA